MKCGQFVCCHIRSPMYVPAAYAWPGGHVRMGIVTTDYQWLPFPSSQMQSARPATAVPRAAPALWDGTPWGAPRPQRGQDVSSAPPTAPLPVPAARPLGTAVVSCGAWVVCTHGLCSSRCGFAAALAPPLAPPPRHCFCVSTVYCDGCWHGSIPSTSCLVAACSPPHRHQQPAPLPQRTNNTYTHSVQARLRW